MLFNVINKLTWEVNSFMALNMLRFEQCDIMIVVVIFVIVRAVRQGICADHGGPRLMYECEVEFSQFQRPACLLVI